MEKSKKQYYLGLDIGTDSVGYAATNEAYQLMKFRGEPVWGVTTFEAASLAEERRLFRTARRRLDRRKQRVQMINEIFAPEICQIDPHFFIRRKESALFKEDTQYGVQIFDGGISDKEYYEKYPTIHHLILDLMSTEESRDIRLVYLACAWLVAHRGHFLSETKAGQETDFAAPFEAFLQCIYENYHCGAPWPETTTADTVQKIMQSQAGIRQKKEAFKEEVYGGKAISGKKDEYPLKKDAMIGLLSGGEVKLKDLFLEQAYGDDKISLGMEEENFERAVAEAGEDGPLLQAMRALYDCALLNATLQGAKCISEAMVARYNRHREDLCFLKALIQKYKPEEYDKVFREEAGANYAAYSGNMKNTAGGKRKRAGKKEFCEFIKKIVSSITPEEKDREKYEDMMNRLENMTFLPKQKDTDNRVIPHQLYEAELTEILKRAQTYLPMLNDADKEGMTNAEKICAVFKFRIPYYVGPLNKSATNAWLERKEGKIYPWNFEKMVDLDASEVNFIAKMTNTCTYLPGEAVLPACSLLYSRFMVLNELNNLKINANPISVALKQELYRELFERSTKKVTKKVVEGYLKSHGYLTENDLLGGMDEWKQVDLKSSQNFKRLMETKVLTESQVEDIINHAAYAEDRARIDRWLKREYPNLSEEDRKYILRLKLKGFGRLSRRLLTATEGCEIGGTGETMTIMQALWETNDNFMELRSDRYSFKEQIEAFTKEYYADTAHRKTLLDRLDDLYMSNPVKRQIIRTLDVCADVVKAMGGAPEKIFMEMARGNMDGKKQGRKQSRTQQILGLYRKIGTEDAARLREELEKMGALGENRLQKDKLYLYYMQLGKCIYTGEKIELSELMTKTYDIDHIYPQCKVQDDSILNNKVLCHTNENGNKGDVYPVNRAIQEKMRGFWTKLRDNGLMTKQKYYRLTRTTGFSADEQQEFINRQIVETRQACKVAAQLLKERYPETELIYVKAGTVSRFRQEYEMIKSRAVNDLHHAKDAYLNIAVGNVYHEKFTRRWFNVKENDYSLKTKTLFDSRMTAGGKTVWQGESDIAKIRKNMKKNAVHMTRYAFCQKGKLFNVTLEKADKGLMPKKKNMPSEKYGGYNDMRTSHYLLAAYTVGKKKDVMFAPVEIWAAERAEKAPAFLTEHVAESISKANGDKPVTDVKILLNGRKIKINTVLSLDRMLVTIRGKSNKGAKIILAPHMPLIVGTETERYIKRLESFEKKKGKIASLQLDEEHDKITKEENAKLYALLMQKMSDTIFKKCPGSILKTLQKGQDLFAKAEPETQVKSLLTIIQWFKTQRAVDLRDIGGTQSGGVKTPSAKLSVLKKRYNDIRIVDMSAAGLFASRSENILELL